MSLESLFGGMLIGVGGTMLALMMMVIADTPPSTKTQVEAIQHGCAQYNPKTAAFEWLNTGAAE